MRFHIEGRKVILASFVLMAVLSFVVSRFINVQGLRYFLYIGFFVEFVWTVSFFRIPNRQVNRGGNSILSSADGEIVVIEETFEKEFYNEKRIQVSVFMSPFNVHVNWYPFDGEVVYAKYHPGRFLFAKNPKSSELNERNSLVIKHGNGKSILIRQIAGVMARRIVSYANVGNKAVQGDEFGIIRFGSRVDFFLPTDAKIKVHIGDKVKAQQSIIAEF
ncbi:MAG: phosphatidylserine decarboxylase family protein [Chlorobi bacterium]|nr:phosphatidylserine decarboxylase family protein [Chlorobiota bacterium]